MAKKAKKKVAKKAAKKSTGTRLSGEAQVKQRETIFHLLMRKLGATQEDLKGAGHNQAAKAAVKMAERHGLKVKVDKKPGEVTRYIATGTPKEPVRGGGTSKKAPKKKVAKKKVKKVTKKPAAEPEMSAAA